jgi:alpha-beta hydrolase superfamily lysophospholipase
VPFFLYGNSFGALLAFNLSIKFPTMFAGMLLSAPFFKHYSNTLDNYKYAFKGLNFLKIGFSINNRDKTKPQYKMIASQYPFYVEDEKQVTLAKLSSICLFVDEQAFAFNNYGKCKTPILVMLAKDDTAVRNSSAVEIISLINNPQNRVVEIENADHTTMSIDFELNKIVQRNAIDFFDSIIAAKND